MDDNNNSANSRISRVRHKLQSDTCFTRYLEPVAGKPTCVVSDAVKQYLDQVVPGHDLSDIEIDYITESYLWDLHRDYDTETVPEWDPNF
jgi:hypothetical protein